MRIIDFFDKGAALYPENIAFVDAAGQFSYREASRQTHSIASALHSNGFGKGSHVGILAPNSSITFVVLLGVYRAAAVWLPINPRNPAAVNADFMDRFDGKLLLYHSAYAAQAREIVAKVPTIRLAVCIDASSDFGASLPGWMREADDSFPSVDHSMEEVLSIFPTGGTTGPSKGVVISHRNIATSFANFYAHFNYHDNTRHLVVAPMTHSAGVLGCLHFARGGTNVIMATVDPGGILRAIQEQAITHLFVPPTLLYMMLVHPDVALYDYSSLQHFLIGAAPTSLEKLKQAVEVFGPVMSEAYGQSEAPSIITAKAPWDYLDDNGAVIESRLKSIGRPAVFNQVAIMGDEDEVIGAGEAGEIVIRGDLVTPGYYKNPSASAEVRKGGWHYTGDIGVMDEEGFVTIVDRKKDMIITGGFNVFPNEIEQLLCTHSAVQDCAVIGIPDEKWGERVLGVVQLKPKAQCQETELLNMIRQRLGSVKAPKNIEFRRDLPRSPNGKVLKTELRKAYWEGQSRGVS
ncbi:MAG: AMP-binding protein [Halioglobus sp.]